jgi:uncharacterized membrane protein YfbV (UPF0208 family)
LQEHYGKQAVDLLRQARMAWFFAAQSKLKMLRVEQALVTLKYRTDFQKLVAEVETKGT